MCVLCCQRRRRCFWPCRSRRSSPVQFSSVAKLFKWQLNSHKMKTRCLHCSYNFWSFLWHLKWLLDKGLTNGYCRISLACVAHFIASVVAYYFCQLAKTSNRLIKGVHTDTDFFPPKKLIASHNNTPPGPKNQ